MAGRLDSDECDHSDGKISNHQTPINSDSFLVTDFRIHDRTPLTSLLSLLFAGIIVGECEESASTVLRSH